MTSEVELKKIQTGNETVTVVAAAPKKDDANISVPVGQKDVSATKVAASDLQSASIHTSSAEKQQAVSQTKSAVTIPIGQKSDGKKEVTLAAATTASIFTTTVKGGNDYTSTVSFSNSIADDEEMTADTFFDEVSSSATHSNNLTASNLAVKIVSGESDKIRQLLSIKFKRSDFKNLVAKAKQSAKAAGIDFDKLTPAQKKLIATAQLAFNKGIIDEKELLEISDVIANTDLVDKLNQLQLEGKVKLSDEEVARIRLLQQQNGRLGYFNIDLGAKMAPSDEKRAALLTTATSSDYVKKQIETRAKAIQEKVITEKTSASVAQTLLSSVQDGFTTMFGLVKENVKGLCKGITGLAQTVVENITSVFTTITKTISKVINDFWETPKGKAIIERRETMQKIICERKVEEKKAEAQAVEAKQTAQTAQAVADEQAKETASTIAGIKSNLVSKHNLSGNLSDKQVLAATRQTSTNDYLAMQKAMGQQAQAEKTATESYWAARAASLKAFFATMNRVQTQLNMAYREFYATLRG